jgi:hypothetical protein
MKNQPEYKLQKMVCQWLELQHKDVNFISTGISLNLTAPQQRRNTAIQKNGFKCPDLIIFEPRGQFAGMFIELKVKSPYLKNGQLTANEHIQAQNESMNKLRNKWYYCTFAWNFEMCMELITEYLEIDILEPHRAN